MSKKHSFPSLFSGCNVHFGLEISSVEVSLVYFSIFSIVSVFLAFKTYLILKFFVIVICNPQRGWDKTRSGRADRRSGADMGIKRGYGDKTRI